MCLVRVDLLEKTDLILSGVCVLAVIGFLFRLHIYSASWALYIIAKYRGVQNCTLQNHTHRLVTNNRWQLAVLQPISSVTVQSLGCRVLNLLSSFGEPSLLTCSQRILSRSYRRGHNGPFTWGTSVPPPKTWFPWRCARIHTPHGFLIGYAVLTQLVVMANRPLNISNNRPHLCILCMRCGLKLTQLEIFIENTVQYV